MHQQPCSDCSTVPTHGLLQTADGWTVALKCECGAKPAHWTPIRHHAKAWRERRRAVAVLHANGWHRHGWRVENVRRYREAVQS